VTTQVGVVEEVFDLAGFLDEFAWIFQSGFVFDPSSPSFKKVLKILDQIPFPIPLITHFSRQGDVKILLTKPLLLPVHSEMEEFVRLFVEDEFLQLKLKATEDTPEIFGTPQFRPEFFALSNMTSTLIEASTGTSTETSNEISTEDSTGTSTETSQRNSTNSTRQLQETDKSES